MSHFTISTKAKKEPFVFFFSFVCSGILLENMNYTENATIVGGKMGRTFLGHEPIVKPSMHSVLQIYLSSFLHIQRSTDKKRVLPTMSFETAERRPHGHLCTKVVKKNSNVYPFYSFAQTTYNHKDSKTILQKYCFFFLKA